MCLALLVVVIYAPVSSYHFVDFDDDVFVSQNAHVQAGLTLDSLRWAFTTTSVFYWQPLLWVSYMLDGQLFGHNPGPYHLVNVALHALNAASLFLVLARISNAPWRSAFVAALFAVHPLRVESVAWISERKDVLSALFWILTVWAYYSYTKKSSTGRYLLVLCIFALGLMAKPMLITLPVILLVLDYWPFGRWLPGKRTRWLLVREKLPFAILSVAVALVTIIGLHQAESAVDLPWTMRIGNALVAYCAYLKMLAWPARLAVLYPYRLYIPIAQLVISFCILAALTAAALAQRVRRPYLFTGWLWFLIATVPTLGLIQSGSQAFADRYTYLPSIGIMIAIVWWVAEETEERSAWRTAAISAGLVLIAGFALASGSQIPVWQTSVTLFSRAAEIAPDNAIVQHNLGYGLAEEGRYAEAIPHYEAAIKLDPQLYKARYNLGRALYEQGDVESAMLRFQEALSLHAAPDYESDIRNALGISLTRVGRIAEASSQFQAALKLKPLSPEIHANWGSFLARSGKLQEAVVQFEIAVRLNPEYTEAHLNLGQALADMGRRDEALREFQTVLHQSQGNVQAEAHIQQLSYPKTL